MSRLRRFLIVAIPAIFLIACTTNGPDAPKIGVTGPAPLRVDVDTGAMVILNLPNGEAVVTADDIDFAEAEIEVRCPADASRCADRAADLKWITERGNDELSLGLSRNPGKGANVIVRLRVPRDRPMRIAMKYGELRVRNHADALTARMTAGEIGIDAPAAAVRAVQLRASFGDASLNLPSEYVEGRRPVLVGAKVDWAEGPGVHPIDARVRFGDVQVSLTP